MPRGEAEAIARRLGGTAVSATARTGLTEVLERAEKLLFNADPMGRRVEKLAAVSR